jgi:hypothetical protein
MTVNTISGTTVNVTRGVAGTPASRHASGSVVFAGVASAFSQNEPSGACTASGETYLPRVVVPSGNVYNCVNSQWQRWWENGFPAWVVGNLTQTYTAAGALTIAPGVHSVNGTTLAMTLANPSVYMNGMIMVISAQNASAHTVTYTAGFGGGTTARDVATFGGAIGDNLTIFANNGVWWVLSTRNVTIA